MHTPFWLTTRDRTGSHAGIVRAFRECRNWDEALEPLLRTVKPWGWEASKAVAIDMTLDFYWIDDNPGPFNLLHLEKHGPDRPREAVRDTRQAVLDQALQRHPQRFVCKPPQPPAPPNAVWINPPAERIAA